MSPRKPTLLLSASLPFRSLICPAHCDTDPPKPFPHSLVVNVQLPGNLGEWPPGLVELCGGKHLVLAQPVVPPELHTVGVQQAFHSRGADVVLLRESRRGDANLVARDDLSDRFRRQSLGDLVPLDGGLLLRLTAVSSGFQTRRHGS